MRRRYFSTRWAPRQTVLRLGCHCARCRARATAPRINASLINNANGTVTSVANSRQQASAQNATNQDPVQNAGSPSPSPTKRTGCSDGGTSGSSGGTASTQTCLPGPSSVVGSAQQGNDSVSSVVCKRCNCGEWSEWPVTAADNNFKVSRLFGARSARVGKTMLLRARVRGALQLADASISLRLPARAAKEGGEQVGIAIVESLDGLCFAQTRIAASSDVVEIEQPALQAQQLYTLTLHLIVEIDAC